MSLTDKELRELDHWCTLVINSTNKYDATVGAAMLAKRLVEQVRCSNERTYRPTWVDEVLEDEYDEDDDMPYDPAFECKWCGRYPIAMGCECRAERD